MHTIAHSAFHGTHKKLLTKNSDVDIYTPCTKNLCEIFAFSAVFAVKLLKHGEIKLIDNQSQTAQKLRK
jgi:hypothetical protein